MGRRGGGSSGGRSFGGGGGSRGFGGRSSGSSGISRGGSSRSSGFSSAGRSGSSSSGRSSSFLGGSSRSSSSGRSSRTRPVGSTFRPIVTPGGGGCGGCGCSTVPIIVLVIVLAVIVLPLIFNAGTGSGPSPGGVTKSTIERTPLPKGSVNETAYFTDNLGWIQNKTALTNGMKNFYKETGVQPYLHLTDNINGSWVPAENDVRDFAESLYDELFTDEAHLLVIFFEPNPDQYSVWYITGLQAKSVIDNEAADILLDFIDRYYHSDLTDEQFFSKAFDEAGKQIMTVPKSPWPPIIITLGGVTALLVGLFWWRKAKEQKNREAEDTERILKTPLDTFGDSEAGDLAKKYQDDETTIIDVESKDLTDPPGEKPDDLI